MAKTKTTKTETKQVKTTKTPAKKTVAEQNKPKITFIANPPAYTRLVELAQLHPTSTPVELRIFAQTDPEVVDILDGYIQDGKGNELVEF